MPGDVAIFTITHNEREFLPRWVDHYSGCGDLYVLDHESTDGSMAGLAARGVIIIPIRNPHVWDHDWILERCRAFQVLLLFKYRVVLFSTPDELVVYTKGQLRDYLSAFTGQYIYCGMGYHVMDMTHAKEPRGEIPLDWTKPLLFQRYWWVPDITYGKPLIATRPLFWTAGFHGASDAEEKRDPDLILVHLHRIDFHQALVRHKRMLDKPLHPSIGAGFGPTLVGEEYRHWFYDLIETYHLPVEEIPDEIRRGTI